MKLFRSLQFKLSAALFLVGAVLIIVSALRLYYRSIEFRRNSVRTHAFTEVSRLSGMAQHQLRRRASRAADLEMTYASTNPDLILGIIIDAEGIVRHATAQQLKGLRLTDTPLGVHEPLIRTVRETMEGRVVEMQDQMQMVAVFPFWEGLARGKGCVVVVYDLKAPLALAASAALYASLVQALALGGGCLALWMMLKLVVTERVAALVAQVHGISLDVEPSTVITGNDELAQVSKAIMETHQRLQHSEQRFRQIAATMRDAFWLAPADRTQAPYANQAYRTLLGRDQGMLATRRWDWLRAISKEDRRRCLEMLRALRHGRRAEEVEVRVVLPDHNLRWVRCRGFAITDGQQGLLSVAGVAMDVSERKTLERRLLDATEEERRRIGMDLHDDLCQRLAAALMKTGVLQSALGKTSSVQEALASELAGDLAEATGVARGFARGLAPVGIEALGLSAALSDLGEFITKGFKVPCRVEYSAADDCLPRESATHIFRIAQELAINAAKHARPSWIEISFEAVREPARLLIAHDGSPYRPGSIEHEGMGMHMVRQRLDALGASLSFHPPRQNDTFTCVECQIPVSQTLDSITPDLS
ncbi:MAG: PAS domain S-box protein [Prosthecobacter sp.]|nr:PAS domain S-box protein [Prosthecobacter sp.]